jgi:hypothetical protein
MEAGMTSETLTAREIFDTVKAHLLKQGRRSMTSGVLTGTVTCAYRGVDGLECAVGCLIRDHEYSREMEGEGVAALALDGLLPERLLPHQGLLEALQGIHDQTDPENWILDLDELEATLWPSA